MDTGGQLRLQILRGRAEEKILAPLRKHGWSAKILREIEADSGYLVIEAERAGARHRVAMLYASATRNEVYRQLAAETEHIYLNGAPYMLESFTGGITTPVSVVDDFFDLLVKWNAETQDAVGIDPVAEEIHPVVQKNTVIQSDNPIQGIWIRLRQLHSVTVARKTVQKRLEQAGETRDDGAIQAKAEGLAFAVRNATDYFRLRDEQGVSQRVLNLYYGTLSFAFAEMLAKPQGPATLGEIEEVTKQGHGLYTVDGPTGGLNELVVGVIASGFFPRWMAFQDKPVGSLPARKPRAYAELTSVPAETHVTVEQLFARVPDIGDLFFEVFDGHPAWVTPVYEFDANKGLSLFGSRSPTQQSAYVDLIDRSGRMTRSDILRLPGDLKEVVEVQSTDPGRHFRARIDHAGHAFWHQALPIHRSPFTPSAAGTLVEPLFGSVTEFRGVALALLYGLSIVVRYRPSIWRRVQEGDLDQYRALVESFLSVVERVLPEQFLESILGVPVYARQPGTL
jgi:hypothetical protein